MMTNVVNVVLIGKLFFLGSRERSTEMKKSIFLFFIYNHHIVHVVLK